jgi:hypothetical protein
MALRRIGRKKTKRLVPWLSWGRFCPERSSKLAWILDCNHASISLPAGSTARDVVQEIARKAHPPIPIESVSDELLSTGFIRGAVFFGYAGDLLDEIANGYPNMYWWISDTGLNMRILPPEIPELSSFDELAGSLTTQYWRDGRLSQRALYEIAKALDEASFALKDELQPTQWQPIAQYNQKFARDAIKSFEKAARRPLFVRSIRRRLYLARERFQRAQRQKANLATVD